MPQWSCCLVADMSLQAILEAIRSSGAARVDEIENRAYIQASQILTDARLEAEQVKTDARAAASAPANRERARIVQQARLGAMQIFGDAREELVDSALDQIHGRLASIRTDMAYPAILKQCVQEALAELGDSLGEMGQAQLEADPRDMKILDSILQEMGLNLPVKYQMECWGGLIAKSKDDRIVVINTLEARLERATPYLRRYLAALFEQEQFEIETRKGVQALVST